MDIENGAVIFQDLSETNRDCGEARNREPFHWLRNGLGPWRLAPLAGRDDIQFTNPATLRNRFAIPVKLMS
jgi:hypothetical protein